MKLKDMTIEELRKYQEIPTAKPRNDIIRVKDLRKWAKANIEAIERKMKQPTNDTEIRDYYFLDGLRIWIKLAYNLEDKV